MNEARRKRLSQVKVFSAAMAQASARATELTQPVYLALYTDGGEKEITGSDAMPRQPMQRGFHHYPQGAHTPDGLQYPAWAGEFPVVVSHARLWTAPISGQPAEIQLNDGQLVPAPLVKFTRVLVIHPGEAFHMPAGSGVSIVVSGGAGWTT